MGESSPLGNEANEFPFSDCCFAGVERCPAKTSSLPFPALPQLCLGMDQS